MSHKVTLIRGDGVGYELAQQAKRCIEATGLDFEWDEQDAGLDVMEKYNTPLPDHVLDSIKKNRVCLKAPVTTPIGTGFRSVNVTIRQTLDLYACVRPAKYYKGVRTLMTNPENIDLVVVRENTEDLYAGIEFEEGTPECKEVINFLNSKQKKKIRPDSGISIKPISRFGSERIVKFAFEYARKNKRRLVSAVHKANIMKFTDGLYMHVSEDVAKNYPDVEFNEVLIDNMCMQLVQKPELYDVLVLPNLYGDIISDLCAGLVGGLGIAPGANIGDKYAVFEATHGSAPKYAGQNKVNPTGLILSGVMMLRHLGEMNAANILENATAAVISEGKEVTYDLKPKKNDPTAVGTSQMADAIIKKIKEPL